MNILIPDKWLREFLKTDATPKQLKEYLSLCGPSIERINTINGETVYDIEVTTNRPDSMSVFGIAREAAAILPRFNIKAKLVNDPYSLKTAGIVKSFVNSFDNTSTGSVSAKKLNIKTDSNLNPRWTSIVLNNVKVKESPKWLQELLTLSGIRPINTVVDTTNYVMRAYGQPAHAFDYDEIKPYKEGIPTMILRGSIKGEKITTLDDKTYTLPGGDIVIEDGSGRLIDLCGIMGATNSSIKTSTTTIVLFLQTYDPIKIRKTSMSLGTRTEAASLFEKGTDTELVMPTMLTAIEMIKKITGGNVASQMYDIYEKPFTSYDVSVKREKLDAYVGTTLTTTQLKNILTPLGFKAKITATIVSVSVPSFRRDIVIDVDIIEEVARMYGYHNIKTRLPETQPPVVLPDLTLKWENEIKIRLRDWGYTETYTYSMISEEQMDIFGLDKMSAYKISNPLSSEWVYIRPRLLPSLLFAVEQNLHNRENLALFELSMEYIFQKGELPHEKPVLIVAVTGEHFYKLKGLAEKLFELFGIPFPDKNQKCQQLHLDSRANLQLGSYGYLGMISSLLLQKLHIKAPITILELDFEQLVKNHVPAKTYKPIPKFPPVIEDLTFTLPMQTSVGSIIKTMNAVSPYIQARQSAQYEQNFTFTIFYLNPQKVLTQNEVQTIREDIITKVTHQFSAILIGNH